MANSPVVEVTALDDVYRDIAALIECAIDRLELNPRDIDYVRNRILELLGLTYYPAGDVLQKNDGENDGESGLEDDDEITIEDVVISLVGHALDHELIQGDDAAQFVDKLLDILCPSPSLVSVYFEQIEREDSSRDAMDWLYDLCEANGSVHRKQLDTNPHFVSHGLVITINTAKPEFKNMKKAAAGNSGQGGYPQCVICHENEGWGAVNKRTLRTIPVELGDEQWFWQFSPYGYFYQHGICVNSDHTPMNVNRDTMSHIIDFVERFPHFFLGCNAALPRIGGSILAHDHYQGGGQLLPMHTGKVAETYTVETNHGDLTLEILDWPGSVLRLVSQSREAIEQVSDIIRRAWSTYTNEDLHIIPFDEQGNPQSSLSPSVIITERGYEMILILRNNAVSEDFPDGIFHANPQYFAIKQEPIGLIEAQGLFILPGRLVEQLQRLEDALFEGEELPEDLAEFAPQWAELLEKCEALSERTRENIHAVMEDEVGSVCYRILENTAVFPTRESLREFLKEIEELELQ